MGAHLEGCCGASEGDRKAESQQLKNEVKINTGALTANGKEAPALTCDLSNATKEIGDDGEEVATCKSARGITGNAEPESEHDAIDSRTVLEPAIQAQVSDRHTTNNNFV